MLAGFFALIAGAIFLYWSAQRFVTASVRVATYFKLSPMFVGIFIMGFATSAPELLTSIIAAIEHVPNIAIGNAYGSNIANIGLCIGFTALLKPIAVSREVLKKEFPFLFVVTLLTIVLLFNKMLTRTDGIILLLCFIGFFAVRIYFLKKRPNETAAVNTEQLPSLANILIWLVISFLLLLFSAQALIWGAEKIALFFKINELIIGLTIVAIGTSLPECAATIAAVKQNQSDLALGNIIGSNIFNTLAAVGITCVIQPVILPAAILYRDISIMTLLTILFLVFSYHRHGHASMSRFKGGLLLLIYLVYIAFMIITL